jgi:hypothetical protein
MAYLLDIFKLLERIDNPKSGDIYSSLSTDEKKGFSALVTMRWLSCTSDERQVMMLNSFVNPVIFKLSSHPQLLMQLLQVCSSKTRKRYAWLGVKSKKKNPESIRVIQDYYDMSAREVNTLNPFPTEAEILQMAADLGFQKDEMTKLKKEFK